MCFFPFKRFCYLSALHHTHHEQQSLYILLQADVSSRWGGWWIWFSQAKSYTRTLGAYLAELRQMLLLPLQLLHDLVPLEKLLRQPPHLTFWLLQADGTFGLTTVEGRIFVGLQILLEIWEIWLCVIKLDQVNCCVWSCSPLCGCRGLGLQWLSSNSQMSLFCLFFFDIKAP